jgi:8-oxo-dGTP pyrophosphatase MutT (NUDIX family)
MIEQHQTQQHNFSQYFVKRSDQKRSNQKRIIRPQNTAFNSLSFRGQRGYSNDIMNKVSTKRAPTYGAILCIDKDNAPLYALVQGRYTGKWSFPKGHANEGELPMECTMREVGEETGIDKLPPATDYIKVGYGHYYVFNLREPIPLIPRDHKEIIDTKWVTLDEMDNMKLNADVSMYRKMNV